ncbi:MAG: hypothetical protein ACI8XC_002448, partial [Gammaproteobacteria bacterium]
AKAEKVALNKMEINIMKIEIRFERQFVIQEVMIFYRAC